mmetsp:Transcript_26096/g.53427  ORF Transcript_26096/g.53427 Transcript_26096/m.53427 type:complete len:392 (-) Transcript_26096:273-1448(-)
MRITLGNHFAAMALNTLLLMDLPVDVASQTCSGLLDSHRSSQVKTLSRDGRPDRSYRIQTHATYDASKPSKVVLMFHGWGGSGGSYARGGWARFADEHNYIIVAPDGLGSTKSWTFPGSSDGIGQDGTSVTTCDNTKTDPNYCDPSCDCTNRCGWTHCLDDDFEFVVDLISDLDNHICVDASSVYAVGISNGGMFAWSLGQNSTTAALLAGIGPIIGLPHHDYNIGSGSSGSDLPVIGVYGSSDCIVPPGDGLEPYVETCDGEAYRYVDARFIHYTWADNYGCDVSGFFPGDEAPHIYDSSRPSDVQCRTHCDPMAGQPMSVDCRADMGHSSPTWTLDVVLTFFDEHAGGVLTDAPTMSPAPSLPSDCTQYQRKPLCERNECTWSRQDGCS